FEIGVRRVINFRQYSNGLDIEFTTNRGKGFYGVNDAEKLEAILENLTRKYNYIIPENSDSVRSRHIPDDVKVEVWQRDQGKCVKCGASEYLEYDHIIPFSKGGANSVNNIQLLCRKCNLAKGAELV
ncbi:MAG: HNH endonuclease, partial [Planctomycetota bacterium]